MTKKANKPAMRVKLPETEDGTVLYNTDPIIIKSHYEMDYIHSYAQDSPFFAGLANGKLLGSRCTKCGYTYATPRAHCMECGEKTDWTELPLEAEVHTFTVCHFGGEAFLDQTPFTLILAAFEGAQTLFMSRLIGAGPDEVKIGMKIKAQFLRNSKFLATDVYFVPA